MSRHGVSQQDGVTVCVHARAQAEAQMNTEVLLTSPVAKQLFTCKLTGISQPFPSCHDLTPSRMGSQVVLAH